MSVKTPRKKIRRTEDLVHLSSLDCDENVQKQDSVNFNKMENHIERFNLRSNAVKIKNKDDNSSEIQTKKLARKLRKRKKNLQSTVEENGLRTIESKMDKDNPEKDRKKPKKGQTKRRNCENWLDATFKNDENKTEEIITNTHIVKKRRSSLRSHTNVDLETEISKLLTNQNYENNVIDLLNTSKNDENTIIFETGEQKQFSSSKNKRSLGRKTWNFDPNKTPEWLKIIQNVTPSTSTNVSNVSESEEKLLPSTTGSVKRRTYELDQSVNGLEMLKTLSESNQYINNSIKASNLLLNTTVDLPKNQSSVYSENITMRRNKQNTITDDLLSESKPWTEIPLNFTDVSPLYNKRCNLPNSSQKQSKNIGITRTSTPIQKNSRKSTNLLENVLQKEFHQNTSNGNVSNFSINKANVSKIKQVPNFAAIHQKALSKVEGIDEYQNRKNERAQFLLSGTKMVKTATQQTGESRKQLRFERIGETKTKKFSNLPATPKPKFTLPVVDSPMLLRNDKTPKQIENDKSKTLKNTSITGLNTSQPVPKLLNIARFKNRIPIRIIKLENKENQTVNANRNQTNSMKSLQFAKAAPKAIDWRKKQVKNVSDRIDIIKGVRSNRRFELLMKMRKK